MNSSGIIAGASSSRRLQQQIIAIQALELADADKVDLDALAARVAALGGDDTRLTQAEADILVLTNNLAYVEGSTIPSIDVMGGRLNAHDTMLVTINQTNGTQQTQITALQTGLAATNASGTSLTTRVQTLEASNGTIITQQTSMNTALTATNARVTTLESGLTTTNAAVTSNTTAITSQSSAISTLSSAITDNTTAITALTARITALETSRITYAQMTSYVDPNIVKVSRGICAGIQYLGSVFGLKTQLSNTDFNVWTTWSASTTEVELPIVVTQTFNLTYESFFADYNLFFDGIHNGPSNDAPQIQFSVSRYIDTLLANKPVFVSGLQLTAAQIRAAVKWYVEGSYEFVVRNNNNATSEDNLTSVSARGITSNGFTNGMTKASIAADTYRISRVEQYTVWKSTTATNSVYFITQAQPIANSIYLAFSNKNGTNSGVSLSAFAQSGFDLKIHVYLDTSLLP